MYSSLKPSRPPLHTLPPPDHGASALAHKFPAAHLNCCVLLSLDTFHFHFHFACCCCLPACCSSLTYSFSHSPSHSPSPQFVVVELMHGCKSWLIVYYVWVDYPFSNAIAWGGKGGVTARIHVPWQHIGWGGAVGRNGLPCDESAAFFGPNFKFDQSHKTCVHFDN